MRRLINAGLVAGLLGMSQLSGCASSGGASNQAVEQVSTPTPLMLASVKGDLEKVQTLIADGSPVNAVSPQGTALSLAVAKAHHGVAMALLRVGARPDIGPPGKPSALMLAASNGDHKLVHVLLAAGAAVNRTDSNGDNAVAYAARAGNLAVVRELLNDGGNVNVTRQGESLLMQVVQNNDLLMAQVLIAAGADVNYIAPDGRTALAIARDHHNRDLEMLLVQAGAQSS